MDYFIVEGNERQGPYDLVAMIRKIRNGTLKEQTLVETGEGESPQPAAEIEKLYEIFHETDDTVVPETRRHHYSLNKSLRGGWGFLQHHLTATLHGGVLMLLTMMIALGLSAFLPGLLVYLLSYIVFLFLLFGFSYFILRMTRGQASDVGSTLPLILSGSKELVIASAIIGIASAVGTLLIIPGLMVLALYIFTPFLILERQHSFWEAMEISRKMAFTRGIDFFSVVFALIVINFIGAVLFLIPLVITLPITFHALAEIYDESF